MSTLGGYRGAWDGYVTSQESKAVVNSAVFSSYCVLFVLYYFRKCKLYIYIYIYIYIL